MQHVFISYASRSEPIATAIGSMLEALGAKCFVYQRPDGKTAVDADTLTKIRNQIEAASFFIQILEGSAGTLVAQEGNTPILQLEMDWFLRKRHERGNRRPLPLVLSFRPATKGDERATFDRFVHWFQEEGVNYEPCDHVNTAYKVANGWFARMRFAPTEIAAIEGSLDVEVGRPTIDKALEAAFAKGEPLSQKYLYTSPVAALLWLNLSRHKKTRTRDLYETINYRDSALATIQCLIRHCANTEHTTPLSIVALGCGDARRESILAQTLASSVRHKKIQLLLVDVSKTLISQAAEQLSLVFQHENIDPSITFALADFEHPTAIASLMSRWSGDHPCISLLLGNTLGNIQASNFLQTIAYAMKPKDLLAVEISVANDAERQAASDPARPRGWRPASPQKDHRFEFVCGPIRALGISPQIERYKVRHAVTETAIEQHFAYFLTAKDMDDVQAVVGNSTYREPMIELVKVATFFDDKLDSLFPSSLRIIAKDIKPCPSVMREGQASRMGFIVAEKTD
jgi:hypothetical protein